ncbi:hypothetical protein CLV78_10821 [Aliiruegeria haliotis]|uniref:Uncharacterized protein n=1 Tax=Aliiruegeria haliotis TaxID=1280846 RepID=A0A2T0RKU9_9RHOB|nr:hypothetical protein CLV78_10821 [Aliiruegeria haliotis]
MQSTHSQDPGYMFLALVILIGGLIVATTWQTTQATDAQKGPARVVTLGQSVSRCTTRSFSSGTHKIGCQEDSRSVRRGGGVFMRPPE